MNSNATTPMMVSANKIQYRAYSLVKTLWPKADYQVSVEGVGAARMRTLNRKFRSKDAPTDVLSFPAPAVFRKQGVLGDLVICVPVARSQAKAQGHSLAAEIDVLLVHGLLHLLGYDHEMSADEEKRMKLAERRCLAKIGGRPLRGGGLIARTSGTPSPRRNSLKTSRPSR